MRLSDNFIHMEKKEEERARAVVERNICKENEDILLIHGSMENTSVIPN